MNTEQIIHVHGRQFKAATAVGAHSCRGCVAENDGNLCFDLPSCGANANHGTSVIFVPAETAAAHKPVHGGYPGFARIADPQTSKDAAADVGGGKLVDIVLTHINPEGSTGKELAQATGRPLNSLTPRFAPLRRAGLIHAAGKRDKQIVWKLGNGVAA